MCNCMSHYLVVRLVNESPVIQNINNLVIILKLNVTFILKPDIVQIFLWYLFSMPDKVEQVGKGVRVLPLQYLSIQVLLSCSEMLSKDKVYIYKNPFAQFTGQVYGIDTHFTGPPFR